MTTAHTGNAAQDAALSPLPVSRGLNLLSHIGFLGIDSLYLVLEYPHLDVFEQWSKPISDFTDPQLHEGIAYEGFVLRRGGLGYKLSVWFEDARLFITDRVNDKLEGTSAEGQGMGVILQLGPLWLRKYGDVLADKTFKENITGMFMLFGIQKPNDFNIRINRMDITVDLVGVDIDDLPVDRWRKHWVGFAKPKTMHFKSKTGGVEGFSVGSSQGSVRFKIYDKVAEAQKIGKYRFWRSVWGLPDLTDDDETPEEEADTPIPVTRFEWSVRCYRARFINLRYLADFTYDRFMALLNYATMRWGQPRVPTADTNSTRWPIDPTWKQLTDLIDAWYFGYDETAKREYVFEPDINDHYLRFVSGTLAGLQVRVGFDKGKQEPASLAQALSFLTREGHSIQDIMQRAEDKWQVFSRLAARSASKESDDGTR